MCTLAVYVQMSAALPLLVAANRDEFLARPASEPMLLAHEPWVMAGQDLSAGGTWLGVNEHRMVVGLLNRRRSGGPDPGRRSRGLLCLEVLQARGMAAALTLLRSVPADAYNSFNLLIADSREAWVAVNNDERVQLTHLPRGVHLLTNLELNDPTCPRIAKSSRLFAALPIPADADRLEVELLPALRAILADHSTALDPRSAEIDTLCVHRPGYGTRSSSVVAVDGSGRIRYWHAPGPPCRTAYAPVPLPA